MRLLEIIQGSFNIQDNQNSDDVSVFFVDDVADIDINEYNEMLEVDKKEYCKKVSGFVGCEPDELFLYLSRDYRDWETDRKSVV